MTNMLEELWYGAIDPNGRAALRRTYQNPNLDMLNKINNEFAEVLQITQHDDFEEYKIKLDSVFAEFEREAFKDGFKIATRLILSCFEKDSSIFDDIM